MVKPIAGHFFLRSGRQLCFTIVKRDIQSSIKEQEFIISQTDFTVSKSRFLSANYRVKIADFYQFTK